MAILVAAVAAVLASPTLAQTGSEVGNAWIFDTKMKDPSMVAATHMARAERFFAKAMRLEAKSTDGAQAAKKFEKACRRAIVEASAALEANPGLPRAYVLRGQARLRLGEAKGAQEDCLQALGHADGDPELLYCYGSASLAAGEDGQALAALARLQKAPATEATDRLRLELERWIAENPEGEAEKEAATWLRLHPG